MKIFAIRGHIVVVTTAIVPVPCESFTATLQGSTISIPAPVPSASNIPISNVFDRDGNGFDTIDELTDYIGECQSIARGDGQADPGAFVTMVILVANNVQTEYLIPHGLGVVPADYSAVNLDSSTTSFTTERRITADATNIIITFDNAPLSPNTARYRVAAHK